MQHKSIIIMLQRQIPDSHNDFQPSIEKKHEEEEEEEICLNFFGEKA